MSATSGSGPRRGNGVRLRAARLTGTRVRQNLNAHMSICMCRYGQVMPCALYLFTHRGGRANRKVLQFNCAQFWMTRRSSTVSPLIIETPNYWTSLPHTPKYLDHCHQYVFGVSVSGARHAYACSACAVVLRGLVLLEGVPTDLVKSERGCSAAWQVSVSHTR